mmetsp:Transcript_82342/g.255932  ORF Transcript_82342/g.255932 Transcript_82342/m.255932 type:complete len:272 (+) Transcript_82342:2-817(+)
MFSCPYATKFFREYGERLAPSAAEADGAETFAALSELARRHGVWLVGGSLPELAGDKVYNTCLVLSPDGAVVARHRKAHLFDIDVAATEGRPAMRFRESDVLSAGDQLTLVDLPWCRAGVGICYDVRFPELYQKLVFRHGAEVLLVPSAFAMKTGEAHWETLLRCRAIETQCYVFAAAQVGQHNEDGNKRQSWGHSLAIDPWGRILADLGVTPGLAVVEVDPQLVRSTREAMPLNLHRRYDLYGDGPHAAEAASAEEREAQERRKDGLFFG